ncbi:hypothetical protein A3D78_06525 [Candidatus Gottesmanbacteria bacterium RIFCSPHIGHO2_02_FULL_39_14]|uniref:Uncharacterized protein n=1 Tax=Candidatus Gottesmanbacteria bacterium RIFCSPHIGHO2_02_FULL_39_14 TaxID=1798383 RepID=A0A1F5ZWP2_9BACT|nr:MAG: hypothetical protein A3D78_06525 [Candidatus Gottesmanbacteria bacterium RIFCSPHIGHO2_02_FULL_39_14]
MAIETGVSNISPEVRTAFEGAMPNNPFVDTYTSTPKFSPPSQTTEFLSETPYQENITQSMMFIPGPKERAVTTDWSLLPVAKHEGMHAFVLFDLGYGQQIDYITITPNGPILGEVSISGHIPFYDFATVAAASSVSLYNYSPSGTSMDKLQIELRDQTFSEHLGNAQGHLKKETAEVLERYFEIITYLGTKGPIDGSYIPVILDLARFEIEMENAGQSELNEGMYIYAPEPRQTPDKQTKIIHVSDGHYRGIWLENGEIIAEVDVFKCPNCGMFHTGVCPAYSKKSNQILYVSNRPKAETPYEQNDKEKGSPEVTPPGETETGKLPPGEDDTVIRILSRQP